MEALKDAMHDVRNYRTHCNLIDSALRSLRPLVHNAAIANSTPLALLLDQDTGARDLFQKFNDVVEDAVAVICFYSILSTLYKVLNKGEAKHLFLKAFK
ncbi:hypothetical protein L7F22_017578 [Adiantum nelumboides]|nr:hypothetical protein [Adiantum nelumboides]